MNAVVIASEGGCCGPFENPGAPETSAPVSLFAGERYYIEALWKQGGGGDYCDVAWRQVGDPAPPIGLPYIPGNRLETYALPGTLTPPTVALSNPANGKTFDAGVAITVTATDAAGHENACEGPYDILIDKLLLGDNVMAAEVHQAGGGSSDMVFGAELIINVPVADLAAARPTLTATRAGALVRLAWTPGGGKLESAPTLTGPWSEVVGASKPHLTAANQSARYYRVRN